MRKSRSTTSGRSKAAAVRAVPAEKRGSLEGEVVALARTGKLAKAGRRAIAAQKKKGLAVTFQRGDEIVKVHADGRTEVLGTTQRPRYTLPKGVRLIK